MHSRPPSLSETLAGVSKFIAVSRITPAFFTKHEHAMQLTCAFLRLVAAEHPLIESAFKHALPLPLSEGAKQIQSALAGTAFTPKDMQWFDAQSTEVLKVLLPVVRDPSLPGWLSETRWAVEGAFEAHDR